MASMVLAGFLFLSMLHLFLPFVTCMSSGCVDGYCVMAGCPIRSGSSRSPFCWMSGNEDGYDRCVGPRECSDAVEAGGSCKAFSCAFFRAPRPSRRSQTCTYRNAVMLRRLQNECSADGATFDSWARKYPTSGDLYSKFEPCTGQLNEEETKEVVKFCYCYSFCGTGQLLDGCEVQGLEGRLDRSANLFSSYKAICKIDCNPVDKLERISTLKNELGGDRVVTKVVTVTEGTTSSQTTESGGSSSSTITASVSATLKKIFTFELGYSSTTDFNWSHSSTTSFSRQESHQARIPVKPGDVVSVYQVVGICNNTSQGTVYTVNTKTLIVRGKDGVSMRTEVAPE